MYVVGDLSTSKLSLTLQSIYYIDITFNKYEIAVLKE